MIGVGPSGRAESIVREAEIARDAGQRFGIGLMAWVLDTRPDQFDASVRARPDLVSVSFGAYGPWIGRLREAGIATATQVFDVESARAAADQGVDLIVARGAEAGGHGRDAVATLPLLQGVLDAVDVPVLAAGGIGTARGLAAVLAAGAAGAWIGTALLACPEATNSQAARDRIRAAAETATVYTRVFDIVQQVPWPPEFGGRALANAFSRDWVGREQDLATDEPAQTRFAADRDRKDYDQMVLYAGQGVGLVTEERPAAEVVAGLADGAEELLSRWG
jgi:nitronate monooxygenase